MNVPFIILVIIFVILVFIYIFINILLINKYQKNKSIKPINIENPCNINSSSIINVEDLQCCYINNNITLNKYVPSINMVVNPVQKPYLEVCAGFCNIGILNSSTCIDGDGQEDFDKCVDLSQPKEGCDDVTMPVAKIGITYYYPYSATDEICKNTKPCY